MNNAFIILINSVVSAKLEVYVMQIVHVEDIDSRKPIYVQVPNVLSDNMKSALKCMGITKLYSHQVKLFLHHKFFFFLNDTL